MSFEPTRSHSKAWWCDVVRAVRPSHWTKNLIVFVPLFSSHQFADPDAWLASALAFASLCLAASAAYQANDLVDLEADRRHLHKRHRPLAAGRLSPRETVALGLTMAASGFILALAANPVLGLVVSAYLGLALLYSVALKRIAFLDVLCLAILYCARILAGAVAIDVMVSAYLLWFSLFFFLSLALMKRFVAPAADDAAHTVHRRALRALLAAAGIVAAMAGMVVLVLYIQDPFIRARFGQPDMLWVGWIILLFWIARSWHLATRGRLLEDIAVAAVRDPVSWLSGTLVLASFMLARPG
jgi:4-hydroxybenzoate polyprenyltransferase